MEQTNYSRINAHAHLLPEPNQIPQSISTKGHFSIDESKTFMTQGPWKRPITHPSFFISARLDWMKKWNIEHEVIITLSQLYANGLMKDDAMDVIKFQNDFHIQLQSDYPTEFTCGFVVQPAYMQEALLEIERCVKAGLKVLCLPSHYLQTTGEWVSIGHESSDDLWAAANEHKLAVQVHPYGADRMIALENRNWRFHLIWMCAQTADAFHEFTLRNLYARFPNVKTCWAHGNQVGAMGQGRREQGFMGRPDLFDGKTNPKNSLNATNMYFDTLVHDPLALGLLVQRFGLSQIVAGLDNPYPLGEMDGIPDSYPGKVIDDAVEQWILSKADREQIWSANVKNWLA